MANDGRGRRAYVGWLEARAANDGGKIDDEASQAIRRGWYLGKDSFKVSVPKSTPYQSAADCASSPGCPNHAQLHPVG